MFHPTQSEFNKYGKTPTEDASAEKHITKAIERFQYRENKTEDVKVNAYKLEEFYKIYEQQKVELSILKNKIQDAVELLKAT